MVIQGDARRLPLVDGSVQCVVTSPPYFGLRDYGVAGQIGLERTPEAYVAEMVVVFRDVWRVLRTDGTVWLNLGDSYAANRSYQVPDSKHVDVGNHAGMSAASLGLKPKDLIGIPWRVAFALQADGWYLRSDIIWSKNNPMPESVQDRPTRAHEYLFLLSKSARYYYDAAAIREPYAACTLREFESAYEGGDLKDYESAGVQRPGGIKARIVDKQRGHGRRHAGFNDRWDAMPKSEQVAGGANKRSVWTVSTQPYPEAHFATFPEKLIEPMILAGCPPGGVVLDPFSGSGTTVAVAERLGRRGVGIELNPAYNRLAVDRLRAVPAALPF